MRNHVMRLCTALLLAGLVLIPAAPVSANHLNRVILYEEWGGKGDAIVFNTSDADLENNVNSDGCVRAQFDPDGDDWNNCANSVRVYLTSNFCLALFNGANYAFHFWTFTGPKEGLSYTNVDGDILTSFKFYTKVNGAC